MGRVINRLLLVAGIALFVSAFTWPWEKEEDVAKPKVAKKETVVTKKGVDSADKSTTVSVRSKAIKPAQKPITFKITDTPPIEEPSKIEKPTGIYEEPAVLKKINADQRAGRVKPAGALQKIDAPRAVRTKASTAPNRAKFSSNPAVVRSEIQKIIRYNTKMQAELRRQMGAVNENLRKAKVYNKVLTNMYPTAVGKNIAVKAVNQERIRVIHKEVKGLAKVPKTPEIPDIPQIDETVGEEEKAD